MFTTAWLLRLLGAWLTLSESPSDVQNDSSVPLPPWPK